MAAFPPKQALQHGRGVGACFIFSVRFSREGRLFTLVICAVCAHSHRKIKQHPLWCLSHCSSSKHLRLRQTSSDKQSSYQPLAHQPAFCQRGPHCQGCEPLTTAHISSFYTCFSPPPSLHFTFCRKGTRYCERSVGYAPPLLHNSAYYQFFVCAFNISFYISN